MIHHHSVLLSAYVVGDVSLHRRMRTWIGRQRGQQPRPVLRAGLPACLPIRFADGCAASMHEAMRGHFHLRHRQPMRRAFRLSSIQQHMPFQMRRGRRETPFPPKR